MHLREKTEGKETKLAIIDNSIDPLIYDPLVHWGAYLDIEWESFRASKGQFPLLKKGYTHLILTGSEASIVERENWVYEEIEIVQEAAELGLSILGSCYGHQLLALALAGPDHIRRSPFPEIGWISIRIKDNNELLGKKGNAFSFSIHFDEVVRLDKAFHVLASSENCQIQAFQYGDKPIWGLQIHPEISISEARILLKNLVSLQLRTTPLFECALKSPPRDSGLINTIIKTFLNR